MYTDSYTGACKVFLLFPVQKCQEIQSKHFSKQTIEKLTFFKFHLIYSWNILLHCHSTFSICHHGFQLLTLLTLTSSQWSNPFLKQTWKHIWSFAEGFWNISENRCTEQMAIAQLFYSDVSNNVFSWLQDDNGKSVSK